MIMPETFIVKRQAPVFSFIVPWPEGCSKDQSLGTESILYTNKHDVDQ